MARVSHSTLGATAFALLLTACGPDASQPVAPASEVSNSNATEGDALELSRTTERSLQEFVEAQGTFCFPDGSGGCVLFVPPVANFFGFTNVKENVSVSVDYAGLAQDWIEGASGGAVSFGTTFDGTVSERPLKDGRVEVRVLLRTHNALAWVAEGIDFLGPLLFGYRAPSVLDAGKRPALVDSFLQVVFINTEPGAPLPDLLQLFFAPEPGQEVLELKFHAHGEGPLRAAFGVTDDTPGRLTVVQNGLFMTGCGKTHDCRGAVADGFPVERIDLHVLGGAK